MLIDWLSIRLDLRHMWTETKDAIGQRLDYAQCVSPDGELVWRKWPPERLRSDTHALSVCLTESYFYIGGSPARLGQQNNVFGWMDLQGCALDMIRFARERLDVWLPDLEHWDCTRIDVTRNLFLPRPDDVLQALEILQSVQGGHFRVSSRGSTAYYNRSSDLLAGKAYAKGPHLEYQIAKGQAQASPDEVEAARHLLRLELSIGSRWLRRWRDQDVGHQHVKQARNHVARTIYHQRQRSVWELTEAELTATADAYWSRIVGQATEERAMSDDELLKKLQRLAPTPGQGRAAYQCWLSIKGAGVEHTKAGMSKASFHRHKRLLFDAGLTWADFSQRKVVALRARAITASPVNTWAELHAMRKAA